MYTIIVDIAATSFLLNRVWKWHFKRQAARTEQVEKKAVQAEYEAVVEAQYIFDESVSEKTRENRHRLSRERQQELITRYPQWTIRCPERKYFDQAEVAVKASEPTKKRTITNLSITLGLQLLLLGVGYMALLFYRKVMER